MPKLGKKGKSDPLARSNPNLSLRRQNARELADFSETDLVEGLPQHHRLRDGPGGIGAQTGALTPKRTKKKKKKKQPQREDSEDDERGGGAGVRRQHSLREMFPSTSRNFKLEVLL
uniref:Uncharacterized protein n=1 Tax=Amphimedon queenslandica TaxID=400682 RepID=A0A1X7SMW0_AMPQE